MDCFVEKHGKKAGTIAHELMRFSLDIVNIIVEYVYEWNCIGRFSIPCMHHKTGDIVVSTAQEIFISSCDFIQKYDIQGSLLQTTGIFRSDIIYRCLALRLSDSDVFSLAYNIFLPNHRSYPTQFDSDLKQKTVFAFTENEMYDDIRYTDSGIILYAQGRNVVTCINEFKRNVVTCINEFNQKKQWKRDTKFGKVFGFDVFQDSVYLLNEQDFTVTRHELDTGNFIQEIKLENAEIMANTIAGYYYIYKMKIDVKGQFYIAHECFSTDLDRSVTAIYFFWPNGLYKGKIQFKGHFKRFCIGPENKLYVLLDDQVLIYEQQ